MARLVVEEVGFPEKVEVEVKEVKKEKPEPEILDEAAKVSSNEIVSDDSSSLTPETVTESEHHESHQAAQVSQPYPSPKKQMSPVFWIIIPGIFLLGAILGGIVFYQKGVGGGTTETPKPSATTTAVTTPSASPSASLDLSKYTVAIFNGSGISGEAGKAKTLLTTAGFTVGTTGNAASYDYTKTIIKSKASVDAAFVSALSGALGKTYVVDTAQTLATSSADTVQVVIGSSKAQ